MGDLESPDHELLTPGYREGTNTEAKTCVQSGTWWSCRQILKSISGLQHTFSEV